RLAAFDQAGHELQAQTWYSIGGGFVQHEGETGSAAGSSAAIPFDYRSAAELIEMCDSSGLSIAQVVLANETAFADEASV
ncbi:L-serine ammonia-lyase, partial [Acinetobacter baumannii]